MITPIYIRFKLRIYTTLEIKRYKSPNNENGNADGILSIQGREEQFFICLVPYNLNFETYSGGNTSLAKCLLKRELGLESRAMHGQNICRRRLHLSCEEINSLRYTWTEFRSSQVKPTNDLVKYDGLRNVLKRYADQVPYKLVV